MYHHLYTIYEDEEICNKDSLDIILEKLEKIEEKLSILEKKLDRYNTQKIVTKCLVT